MFLGRSMAVVVCSLALAACGGGGGDNDDDAGPQSGPVTTPPPARGTLIQSPPTRTASLSAASLLAAATSVPAAQQLLELISPPKCGIDIHQLRYNTVDPAGAPTTASGALMIPTGTDSACQGPRPIVVYAHGTQVQRTLNQANITNEDNLEALLAAAAFTAQGYVLVAPNYAGFDTSTLPYHPYLNADQQSKDVVDALTAARSALPTSFAPTVTDSGKLFVTGYSQGGHVAMATHRLMQQTGATITASAPMSGPYAIAAFADAVFLGQVSRTTPLFLTYTAVGYQRAYGDVYTTPTEIFEARYATGIETLLPSAVPRTQLFAEGRLPRDQLFSSTPPDPAYAPYTPATAPANLARVFAAGFGPDHLVTNAYRLAYLRDAQLNPDGGFPTVTDGRPAANPGNGLRRAFKTNDLRTWTPTAPVFLCAGNEDPTVLYMNTQLIRDYWAATGATTQVRLLDLESALAINDPYAARKLGFAGAKAAVAAAAVSGGATDGGAAAVIEAYHSTLVPPFCLSAVKSFFDTL
jgi:predicted esterase